MFGSYNAWIKPYCCNQIRLCIVMQYLMRTGAVGCNIHMFNRFLLLFNNRAHVLLPAISVSNTWL